MTKFERLTHNRIQRGFSLIEVLVALVILVIGLIGIFNLHIVAKRGSFESFQQTQASYYATDIINRMKLNRTQLTSYEGTYNFEEPPSMAENCEAQLCSPEQMATWDKYDWGRALFGSLEVVGGQNVGGLDTPTACVQVSGNDVLVVIVWKGIRSTNIDTSAVEDISGGCDSEAETPNRRIFSIRTVII